MKTKNPNKLLILFSLAIALLPHSSFSQGFPFVPNVKVPALVSDAFMRDTTADTGTEPNPNNGPMWKSPDIWVRQNPDPNWDPYPYTTGSPTWTPQPHQSPRYRHPLKGAPNYVYVRVTNRGGIATTGTERLRVYFAKASTGLAWPDHWTGSPTDDNGDTYYALTGGVERVFGKEITKPRMNAANASPTDRARFIDAIVALNGTNHPGTPYGSHPGITMFQDLQNDLHLLAGDHSTQGFGPWHREYMNRYEQMLLSIEPRLTFLYWNWNEDPSNAANGFNFFSTQFMGSGSGTVQAPFTGWGLTRAANGSVTSLDSSYLGSSPYSAFRSPWQSAHNSSHGRIGAGVGNFSTTARDPFFFLLHTNCDRIWAQWQRDQSLNNYTLDRLDRDNAYNNYSTTSGTLSGTIPPWDGSAQFDPWSTDYGSSWINQKSYQHASVINPAIYDTAPLYVPVLQANESVVIEIPWYTPNPNHFSSFGDKGHFCLLARIETDTSTPYGMTFPEANNLGTNVRNNNNIAWKNVTVITGFPPVPVSDALARIALGAGPVLVRNINPNNIVNTTLHFKAVREPGPVLPPPFTDYGTIIVDVPPEIIGRWIERGGRQEGIEVIDDRTLRITGPEARIFNIPLNADEVFALNPRFQIGEKRHELQDRRFQWDILQYGTADDPNELVGGNTYDIDFNKIRLIQPGSKWNYLDLGRPAGEGWNTADFDDSKWKSGSAGFGHGYQWMSGEIATRINVGDFRNRLEHGPGLHEQILTKPYVTSYFRRSFQGGAPGEYRTLTLATRADDGVRVFLNGTEIYRSGLPAEVVGYDTPGEPVNGARERQYVLHDVSQFLGLLNPAENVIAAEVHQANGSSDAFFDLELFADGSDVLDVPPVVAINLHDSVHCIVGGTMCSARAGQDPIRVIVDAVDDGEIVATRFYLNGKLLEEANGNTLDLQFFSNQLQNNRNVLRAEAIDAAGNVGSVERTIKVVDNLPPVVSLKRPLERRIIVKEGSNVEVEVLADDPDGEVTAVRFYYKSCNSPVTTPPALFAEVSNVPYTATAHNIHCGSQSVFVEVEDEQGAVTSIEVKVLGVRVPDLEIHSTPPHGEMSIIWDQDVLQSAKLQSSTDLVNWVDVADASSPHRISTGEADFSYLRLEYDLREATRTPSNDPVFFGINSSVTGDNGDESPATDLVDGDANSTGVAADQWQLPNRDGNAQSLDDFRGEPLVMLFFLGHDCLVCLEQLEAMKAAHSAFESAGVNVVAVSPDPVEDLAQMQEFPFSLLSDAELSVFGSYGITDPDGEPTHAVVIIDGGGQLVLRELGDLPDMNLGRILSLAGGQ